MAQDIVTAPVPVVGNLIFSNHGNENASKTIFNDVSILEIMTISAPALHRNAISLSILDIPWPKE